MVKNLISVLNDLTDRGLVKESAYLHSVFTKVAYESVERARALLNSANPDRNSSSNERSIAADRLNYLLKNPDRPEFGYKELATLIGQAGVQDSFDSEDFLGGVLTNAEVDVLKQLLKKSEDNDRGGNFRGYDWGGGPGGWRSGEGFRGPRWEEEASSDEANSDREDELEKIRQVIEFLVGKVRPVTIKRSSGTSDATVSAISGDAVTFIVPVSDVKLGFKVLTLSQLQDDNFVLFNREMFSFVR